MRTRIVQIGKSRGIRIPKPLLAQAHLRDAVEIDVEDGALVIRCADAPRAGWNEAFSKMAAAGDDALLDDCRWGATKWDETGWEWD